MVDFCFGNLENTSFYSQCNTTLIYEPYPGNINQGNIVSNSVKTLKHNYYSFPRKEFLLSSPCRYRPGKSRGPGRYSATQSMSESEVPLCYREVMSSPVVHWMLEEIANYSLEYWWPAPFPQTWAWGRVAGDVVGGDVCEWQHFHSDWPGYKTNSMKWGAALVVGVGVGEIPVGFAPTAVIPWNIMRSLSTDGYYHPAGVTDAREWFVTLKHREVFLRDARVCHAGSPNLYSEDRALMGMQVLSPQYLDAVKIVH